MISRRLYNMVDMEAPHSLNTNKTRVVEAMNSSAETTHSSYVRTYTVDLTCVKLDNL